MVTAMKCGNPECMNAAVATVYWPGKSPSPRCHSCGLRDTAEAQRQNFHLAVEELAHPVPSSTPTMGHLMAFGV